MPARPSLRAADVWCIRDPEAIALGHLADVLDEHERRVMVSYVHRTDRQRYLAAHVGVRMLVGERLGIDPSAVRLGRNPCPQCGLGHGRPVSLDDPAGTSFSLSRTRGMVVVALADVPVGIDVESVSALEMGREIDPMLHPDERAAVRDLPTEVQALARLSCWARTEAYLKARGWGLGISPATVAVGPAARFSAADAAVAPGSITALAGWSLVDLDVGSGHVAALALGGASDQPADPKDPENRGPGNGVRVHDLVIG